MAAKKEAATVAAKAKAKAKTKKKRVATKPGLKNLTIKIANIELVKNWNRIKLGDNSQLVASISKVGLTYPLLVREGSVPGKVQLVDGMCRLAACKQLNLNAVAVCYSSAKTDEDAEEQAAVANLARKGNTPYEKVLMFQRDSDVRGKSHDEIARIYACSTGYVSQHLAVLKADPKLQKAFKEGAMTLVMFRHFSKLDREKDSDFYTKMMDKAFAGSSAQAIGDLTDSYNTRKVEKAAREAAKVGAKAPKTPVKRGAAAHKPRKGTPKLVIPDYRSPAVSKRIKYVGKKDTVDWLDTYRDKALSATTLRDREYNLGVLMGMELITGIQVED